MNELKRQPGPTGSGEVVYATVLKLLEERVKQQEERYSTRLRINNGRDALYDALQEAIDAVFYTTQAVMERELEIASKGVTIYEVDKKADNYGKDLVAIVDGEWLSVEPFYDNYFCDRTDGYIVELDEIKVLFALPDVKQVIDIKKEER
ncbi:MAG: hypothetical protein U9N61_08905 [Euryarchaeota archaeon]|nr:hypothetical protein [Euryarchaeota archaeon]